MHVCTCTCICDIYIFMKYLLMCLAFCYASRHYFQENIRRNVSAHYTKHSSVNVHSRCYGDGSTGTHRILIRRCYDNKAVICLCLDIPADHDSVFLHTIQNRPFSISKRMTSFIEKFVIACMSIIWTNLLKIM